MFPSAPRAFFMRVYAFAIMYLLTLWDWDSADTQWAILPALLVTRTGDLCRNCGGPGIEITLEWLGMGIGLGWCLS